MPNAESSPKPSPSVNLENVTLRLLGGATRRVADLAPARLMKCPMAQLREAARLLGLVVNDEQSQASLVALVAQGLAGLAAAEEGGGSTSAEASPADAPEREGTDTSLRAKFDLGQEQKAQAPRFIPWSYGQDRITAMVVNPQTLYVYWEVADEAIGEARRQLGPGGSGAWLCVRVYDVSGRLFDGTNALGYADYKVDRADRQWFVAVDRPGSTAIVDVGMKSTEGYFFKIARSGRADFPRHARAAEGAIEWLTVRTASGDVGAAVVGSPPAASQAEGRREAPASRPRLTHANGEAVDGAVEELIWRGLTERWWAEGRDVIRREWTEAGRTFEWMGPLIRTSWEAGPFPVPVEAPAVVHERYEGPVAVYTVNGQTRVVFGPWQVVIRGLGGWAEKRTIARWEVYTSWVAGEGVVRELQALRIAPMALVPGASEALFAGASELRWLFGSELRLAGASEVYLLGASELRMFGASESMAVGASEVRFRGASEVLFGGASELHLGGASEQWGGASEAAALPPAD
jgi:hypothetical protein